MQVLLVIWWQVINLLSPVTCKSNYTIKNHPSFKFQRFTQGSGADPPDLHLPTGAGFEGTELDEACDLLGGRLRLSSIGG